MSLTSIGDLALSYQTRLNNTRLKSELGRISQELSSGRTSNLRARTGGDLGSYAGLENAIGSLAAYKIAATEAGLAVGAVQRSLETVQKITADAGPALLLASSSGESTLVQAAASDARAKFSTVISVLNTRVADRALLSGTAVGTTSLADAETMIAELRTAISAETTAAGVTSVVDAWFDDPGGGFETNGYLGSTTDLSAFRIGPQEEAALGLRGDNQDLRDVMKAYALAALVADGALSGQHVERAELLEASATRLLAGDKALAELRAGIGTLEARVDTALARNGAETVALEIARSGLVEVDPYESATELQAFESQLETLYTITARLSRLSLVDYLR